MQQNLKQGRTPVVFRQFSRKSYALFAVLHREVRIGVLSVATLASAAPCLGQALREPQPALPLAADTVRLGAAEITASRAPLSAEAAARQVTALTRDDLAAAGVTSINDVLKLATGVDVRQRGGFGVQTDISIDGGTFDQITLLVNGVAINNPQTGHNAADFPVNLSDIERIEVLRGAAARIFGSQAFSGAINIVTAQAEGAAPDFRLSAEAGSYGTARTELRGATRTGHTAVTASGSMHRSDGAVSNGQFLIHKLYATARTELPAFRLNTQAAATWNTFGANTFYSAAYPAQWEDMRRVLLSVGGQTTRGRIRVAPTLSLLRNTDHFQLIRHSHTGENFHQGNVATASLNAWTDSRLGRTLLGVEVRYEDILSSNLGLPTDSADFVRVKGQADAFYTHKDHRTNTAFFAEHTLVMNRWTLSAGLTGQRNTSTAEGWKLYPGVDIAYRPAAPLKLFASLNRSMRLPTFTDLYYKSPTQQGNRNLRAERNLSLRLGADLATPAVKAQATAFLNKGNNMIDWVMLTPDDVFHATSFRLTNYGLDLSATLLPERLLGKHQPLRRLTMAYAWNGQHRHDAADFFKSNYALEYLRHKFTATLRHTVGRPLTADWTLRLQHREGAYIVYRNAQNTGRLHPYGTHALLDLRLSCPLRRLTLYADLQNITARRYYDLGNVRQAGFTARLGLTTRLGGPKN